MELGCCNLFFGSGSLEPWDYFFHLQKLEIDRCDMLVHWPEKVFQSLVSLRRLVIKNCKNLTGYTQAPLEPSETERIQHLPGLESLLLEDCASLVEMFNVPASLKEMNIYLCRKLESLFGKQQGLSELVEGSSCSEAIVPTAISGLPSSPMNHFYPCLESLWILYCESLSAVLRLPPSLKTIYMAHSSILVLSCQLDGFQKQQEATSINVPESSSSSSSSSEHSLTPCLESLVILSCAGMLAGILRLPMSLKRLDIRRTNGLMSLESLHPASLEDLQLVSCSTLASLPNELQAYKFLQELAIKGCPAVKKLPRCLERQLGSIKRKRLDAHYEGIHVFLCLPHLTNKCSYPSHLMYHVNTVCTKFVLHHFNVIWN
ncbi:uncharacterized protein [Triticum aestivum]|uniref:uncharacterized protein n=1 Tax=Triticum aestivum TaxID=4565 RepID=UPI001D021813|nr:uncharacterized protein LOC123085661 [Triticum aestivum]XP_044363294.1 uncharacterized protein LOC123085679 [Triticum aestivum]